MSPTSATSPRQSRTASSRAGGGAVGVLGATRSGRHLAQAFAQNGFEVAFVDANLTAVQSALHEIAESLQRKSKRGLLGRQSPGDILPHLHIGCGLERLRHKDLVFECTYDEGAESPNWEESLGLLEAVIERNTPLVCSVGSRDDLDDLLSSAPDESRIIPMTLTLPNFQVSLVQLLETPSLRRSLLTQAHQIFDAAAIPAIVTTTKGDVIDRLLLSVINQACQLLREGDADVETIDNVLRLTNLHNLGPLQLADVLGLDSILAECQRLVAEEGAQRYQPDPLLCTMVEAGKLGVQTGRGFYRYASSPE